MKFEKIINKMLLFIGLLCIIHTTFAAPQFLAFENGKVGVNFAGFHAEAGLGGQPLINGWQGGLSASAGTPWGQNAVAGLGGFSGAHPFGVLYAGAQAIPSIGANAVLGGEVGRHGFIGSEAHVLGNGFNVYQRTPFIYYVP